MRTDKTKFFMQTFSLDSRTGRLLLEYAGPVRPPAAVRRFSCVFLSTSAQDAASLNRQQSAVGIRVHLARDTREAALLLSITGAKILLIDIDRTIEPWLEILRTFEELRPGVPKIVLTSRGETARPRMPPQFALDIVRKPARLGDLLGSLESAHSLEQELNDPKRARERIERVLSRIRSEPAAPAPGRFASSRHSLWRLIQSRLSGMMDRVTHAYWKPARHRTRNRKSHA